MDNKKRDALAKAFAEDPNSQDPWGKGISHDILELHFKHAYDIGHKEGVNSEWKEIRKWKPTLHFCPEWDYLLIDKNDPEYEACLCVKR